jgi:outer membrane protein OmpA-like peptidoglycan-associated protein
VIRRQLVAVFLLLQLALLGGCATVTNEPAAGADTTSSMTVVALADGSTRVDIATDAAFDYGSAVLRPVFAAQLSQLVKPYSQHPVQVSGYTDNVGAAAYNLDLSQQRAQAVADVLITQGFNATRLSVSGYGAGHPVASNADESGRYRNRRIELLITVNTDD